MFTETLARRDEALLMNQLLPEEVTPELLAAAERHVIRIGKDQATLTAERKRKQKLVERPAHKVDGAKVFFVDDAVGNGFSHLQLARNGMTRVRDRCHHSCERNVLLDKA